MEEFTVYTKLYKPTDPRLGRHVRHDSRSRLYPVEAAPIDSLVSVRHQRRIPILDQGNLGSCTGNAAVGCIGTEPFYDTLPKSVLGSLNERLAVEVYGLATQVDSYPGQYPPTDTGSDGLSVAKVLKTKGLISGYLHAFSLEAALTALSKQPIIVGTEWLQNMFTPAADGRLNISGTVAGGHEYEIDELDVESRRVWMDNSWATTWGDAGRAYLTWDDFGALLQAKGDVTVFTPVTVPAPTPTPTPPQPAPPAPPAPPTPANPKAKFSAALKTFEDATAEFLATV